MSLDRFDPLVRRVDGFLAARIDAAGAPAVLTEAMHYATLGGGKRVRPLLVYLTAETHGIDPDLADWPAAAIEMIHAYSLVHDDLPAMDDDDLRRGRPTCHRQFDEATAILAGDALQALAFETLADMPAPDSVRLRALRIVANAAGAAGMVRGQVLDIAATGRRINHAALVDMHRGKTGALIRAATCMGAVLAAADTPTFDAWCRYGDAIGLAFQVRDDILDEIGDEAEIGKRKGADKALEKSTFVSIHGLEGAESRLATLRTEALAAMPITDEKLEFIAEFIATRNS